MREIIHEKTLKDEISGKELINESIWRSFTDEEKESIVQHIPQDKWLKIYPEDPLAEKGFKLSIENFLMEAEMYCNHFLWWKEQSQGITQHKDDLQAMQKAFKMAMKELKKIYEVKVTIPARREISFDPMILLINIVRQRTAEKAFTAYNILESLSGTIKYFQEPNPGRGAPGISKATTSLAIELAKSYRTYFGEIPTAYKDGSFYNIFDAIMAILLGPGERDYTRAVKIAIKKIQPRPTLRLVK